jgi:hypothetical protein
MTPADIKAKLAAVNKELNEIEAQIAEANRLAGAGSPVNEEARRWRDRRTLELAQVCRELRIEAALNRAKGPGAPQA